MKALALTASMLLCACGGGVVTRADAPAPLPVELACVSVQSSLADMTVESDGASLGALSTWRGRRVCLRPGAHALRFTAPGHYPLNLQVDLKPQETKALTFDLVPMP